MKPDEGHIETEKLLADMERRIAAEYRQAVREVRGKLDDYWRRFEIKDEKWMQWVAEGRKTDEEYERWRTGQLIMGRRWEAMRDTLAHGFHNANVNARKIIDGGMPEVYVINHDYATYQVEHDAQVDTSYTLYDRDTVVRVLKEDPDLLPGPGRKAQAEIDAAAEGKDIRWNRQRIQSAALQGILQGEAIPAIARRLAASVGDSNHKAAIRNARTMTTGAQNAGRVHGYQRAEAMGIDLRQTWVATLDKRTRHEHRILDGQTVDVGKSFLVDGYEIRYPGDPDAPGHLIWNCRCTLISQIKGFERNVAGFGLRNDPDVGGMTYEEWKTELEGEDGRRKRAQSNPITLPEEKAEAIKQQYIGEYRRR